MLKTNKIFIVTLLLLCAVTLCSCTTPSNTDTQNDVSFSSTNSSLRHVTLEEYLSQATNIASATYVGIGKNTDAYQDLVFTPVSQLKGNELIEDFHIRIYKDNGSSATYTPGKTYLLILRKIVSVYYPYDIYSPSQYLIPVDNTDLSAEDPPAPNIVSYIKEYIKNDTSVAQPQGTEYIRSTDLVDIVSGSSIIAKVTPIEYIGESKNNDTERYLCTVDSVIKGNLSQETVKIIFISDTVTVNSQYVVMIEQLGTSTFYTLSSRNSVYPVDDSNIVQQVEEAMAVK